jgi:hypothetical protein
MISRNMNDRNIDCYDFLALILDKYMKLAEKRRNRNTGEGSIEGPPPEVTS